MMYHRELACSHEPALIPASTAEVNDFRWSILNEKVVHPAVRALFRLGPGHKE